MDRYYSAQTVRGLGATEWEVLYLLYDALDQLRKLTLSFSELRYLAVEHTEPQIRERYIACSTPQPTVSPLTAPLSCRSPTSPTCRYTASPRWGATWYGASKPWPSPANPPAGRITHPW